jgi:xanthine dehydrogenase FAD-binding subunit
MPISTFFTGPGKTRKSLCELVTGVRIPVPGAHHVSRFYKHGTRPALDISTISIGFAADRQDGVLTNVRVAFGAVAPTPLRATATESALEGRHLDAATIEAAAIAARDEVNPIDDVRATAWYRKEMIHNMTKRMLENVAQA